MTSPNRKPVTLRLTSDLDKKLTEVSRKLGISRNSLMVILLDKGVEDKIRDTA